MSKLFGRTKTIERIWKLLEEFSILFTAERRVGKTTVLKELKKETKNDFLVIFSDVEKIDTPLEFINNILNDAEKYIGTKDKSIIWLKALKENLGGIQLGGMFKIPEEKGHDWKQLLTTTLTSICKNTDKTVVFLWDEIPYMLQKIAAHEHASKNSENNALKILDVLRSLRQENDNLRMVFTGSIGLHHVLQTMRNEHYASEPVNDMEHVALPALDVQSAHEMVKYQLKHEAVNGNDDIKTIPYIAQQCDYIPFYIEKLIRRLSVENKPVTIEAVDKQIAYILTDSRDEWELEHFRSRLKIYFKGDIKDTSNNLVKHAAIAKAILNHCAVTNTAQSIDDCLKAVKLSYAIEDRDIIIETLNNLAKDHYLIKDEQGYYQFCFSLVRRWWLLAEGLKSEANNHA